MHELLDGEVDHGPVEDRKKVLVGDPRHGLEPAPQASGEDDALHRSSPLIGTPSGTICMARSGSSSGASSRKRLSTDSESVTRILKCKTA